jgi:putative spermidine/putrescine transport system permease protein
MYGNNPMTMKAWRNVVIAAILFTAIVPVIPVLVWSVTTNWQFPQLLPERLTLRGWQYVLEPYARVFPATMNSLLIATTVTLISFPLGIPAARALGLYKFRGKSIVQFLLLAPLIVPELPIAIGIHILFIKYGLANSLLGVMLVHVILVLPYIVLVLSGVFANYAPEAEESARTLGASPARVFLHITLPAIFPGMMVAGLFAFIRSWRTYVFTLIIGGGSVETLPLVVFSFIGEGDNQMSAVLSLVLVAPAALLLVFTARYLTGRRGTGAFVGI